MFFPLKYPSMFWSWFLEYSLVHDKKGEQRERGEEGKDDEIGISEGGFEGFFEQVEEP